MSAQDLTNWGELLRLLSGSCMNIRKNKGTGAIPGNLNTL